MTIDRRRFLRAAAASAAAPFVLAPVAHARRPALLPFTYFDWRPIRRGPQRAPGATGYGSGILAAYGEGGNALVAARDGEILLVDCKNAPFGDLLLREAKITPYTRQDSELALVVNTHHHADHTGGNWAFTPDHAVLAHAKVAERVESQVERYTGGAAAALEQARSDDPKSNLARRYLESFAERAPTLTAADFKPTDALKSDHETRDIGGMTVHLYHFGPGHTDTDVAVHFPEENIIHTGDLLFHDLHPFCDANGGCTTIGWQKSLEKLIELANDDTIVVPGHGELTDIGGLRAQRLYFDRVRELVQTAHDEGKTREEVTAMPAPDRYAGFGHERLWPIVLGFIYDELARAESE